MSAQRAQVNSRVDTELPNLGSLGDYVTVWGEYVPEAFQPLLLLELTEAGYPVRGRGHTIQVRLAPGDVGTVDSVRRIIRTYKGEGW